MKIRALIAIAIAAACGGAEQPRQAAGAAKCSMSLGRVSPDVAEQMVLQVNDGSIDPCGGTLAQRERYRPELASVEEDDNGFLTLVFWMRLRNPNAAPVYQP
jgi:alkylation response protein AidB-like acyl-CoA dehydrogenase